MERISSAIANNIKLLRKEKKMSLDELSRHSGVSKSMIGQVERGEVNPTISTVWKIAEGLKVSFTELIALPRLNMDLVDTSTMEPLTGEGAGYRNYPLFPFDGSRRFEVYRIEIDPGASLDAAAHAEGTQEFITVFSGKLMLTAGDKDLLAPRGSAVRFDADVPHAYRNVSDTLCEFSLIIYYPERDRRG